MPGMVHQPTLPTQNTEEYGVGRRGVTWGGGGKPGCKGPYGGGHEANNNWDNNSDGFYNSTDTEDPYETFGQRMDKEATKGDIPGYKPTP